jgi:hypothetical protein
MEIVVANGFVMERCTFFSREYHCCVLHNTRCKCEDYNPRNSKPTTNADKLRAMTDEELAYFIAEPSVAPPPWCKEILCPHWYEDIVPCHECALNWLKQEADNGQHDS